MRPNEKKRLNQINLIYLLVVGQFSVSALAFLSLEANTLKEYAESFYASLTITSNCYGLWILFFKSQDIFKFIEHIEETLEKCK